VSGSAGQLQQQVLSRGGVCLCAGSARWVWWLDEHTTRLLIDFIGLGETITVSVDPGPPRVLPREQVRRQK
jgi:hypothetical protein